MSSQAIASLNISLLLIGIVLSAVATTIITIVLCFKKRLFWAILSGTLSLALLIPVYKTLVPSHRYFPTASLLRWQSYSGFEKVNGSFGSEQITLPVTETLKVDWQSPERKIIKSFEFWLDLPNMEPLGIAEFKKRIGWESSIRVIVADVKNDSARSLLKRQLEASGNYQEPEIGSHFRLGDLEYSLLSDAGDRAFLLQCSNSRPSDYCTLFFFLEDRIRTSVTFSAAYKSEILEIKKSIAELICTFFTCNS